MDTKCFSVKSSISGPYTQAKSYEVLHLQFTSIYHVYFTHVWNVKLQLWLSWPGLTFWPTSSLTCHRMSQIVEISQVSLSDLIPMALAHPGVTQASDLVFKLQFGTKRSKRKCCRGTQISLSNSGSHQAAPTVDQAMGRYGWKASICSWHVWNSLHFGCQCTGPWCLLRSVKPSRYPRAFPKPSPVLNAFH